MTWDRHALHALLDRLTINVRLVAGAGLSVSEGSPGVSGLRPPTPATLASIYLTKLDRRTTTCSTEVLHVPATQRNSRGMLGALRYLLGGFQNVPAMKQFVPAVLW